MVRKKMTRQARAKQFMPFAALKGYEEALRKMEWLAEHTKQDGVLLSEMQATKRNPLYR